MLAPAPVIRYCPLAGLNSVAPFFEGSPTSPDLVKAPRLPSWAKAAAANTQLSNMSRMVCLISFSRSLLSSGSLFSPGRRRQLLHRDIGEEHGIGCGLRV